MFRLAKLRYRHKIAAFMLAFTMLPLIGLGSFVFMRAWDDKVQDILTNNSSKVSAGVSNVNDQILSAINKLTYLCNNYYINDYIVNQSNADISSKLLFSDYLQGIIGAIRSENPKMEVAVYNIYSSAYIADFLRSKERAFSQEDEGLVDQILKADENSMVWRVRNLPGIDEYNVKQDYLCLYRRLVYKETPAAIAEVRVPLTLLRKNFSFTMPKESFIAFFIGNEQVEILNGVNPYASASQLLDNKRVESEDSRYYVQRFDTKSQIGTVVSFIPKSYVLSEMKLFIVGTLGIFIILAAILIFMIEFVSFVLTKRLTGLIKELNNNIDTLISSDEFKNYDENDEFGKIGKMIYELLMRIKEYYNKIADFQTERKALELELLQARINPHFLYNTLSTMKWVCGDRKIQMVIDSMVKYYRLALSKGSSILRVSQELEMVEEYLKLQKFAYGSNFEYTIQIEEGVGDYSIIKHLLQPIVENAVLHGINGIKNGACIEITGKCEEDKLVFCVRDNGLGMSSEKLERMLKGTNKSLYGGYGASNVMKRIENYYGENCGLTVESEVNQGTAVTISILAQLPETGSGERGSMLSG